MTGFVAPMMASVLPEDLDLDWSQYVAEEKFDGHRIVVRVSDTTSDLFGTRTVRAWSRYGIERILPPHIRTTLETFEAGVYDGELLVVGARSYDVTRLKNTAHLTFVVFDLLELLGRDLRDLTGEQRRKFLETLMAVRGNQAVQLATQWTVSSADHLRELAAEVWQRDGEGLILKHKMETYRPGKRSKRWLKVKALRSAVLTVIGYRVGKLGPQATVVLRDDEGNETTVKALNDRERADLEAEPDFFVGRKLRIDYQERTPDGSYRHPRWDRWEDQ